MHLKNKLKGKTIPYPPNWILFY